MPKYTANAYLVHKGKIVKTDEEIELTKEQADRLGDKVKSASTRRTTTKEEPKKETK